MTEFATILFVLIGVIIGFVAGRATSRAGDANKLHNELTRTRKELTHYKREMTDHFSSTASLLEQLDEQYQRLSQHMVEQSQKLIPAENNPFQTETTEHADGDVELTPITNTQPLDYSGQPSGLLSDKNRLA